MQEAFLGELLPHQTLRDAAGIHRHDVKHHAEQRDPEMPVGQLHGMQLGVPQPREQPVEHRERDETVPAQRAGVNMRDGPVRVMRQGVHRFDGEHRAFERGHAVSRYGHHHEFQHRLLAHLVPRAAQREQAVQHAAPTGRDEHQREHHAERLRPIRQRRVQQVMRPGPDVDEDKRPKMNDRKPVAEHRTIRRFRQEVIHEAEERRGEEECHGVVPVPPLHQCVLDTGVDRIALEHTRRHRQRVDDVQQGHGDGGGDVKPDGHVDVFLAALHDGSQQIDREHHPDQRDGDVNRPFEFRVFLARRETKRQRDGRADDDCLPAPEIYPAQRIAEHARLA